VRLCTESIWVRTSSTSSARIQLAISQRVKFRRDTLLAFFERAELALVGMEACPGSQWLARKLQAMGHSVRIIPAQFVKPYVKSNKNDIIDAAAIAEAVVRPTMRFVQIKRPDQVDLQALHRIRDQLVSSRTRLICQIARVLSRIRRRDPPGCGCF
jgi:transposase